MLFLLVICFSIDSSLLSFVRLMAKCSCVIVCPGAQRKRWDGGAGVQQIAGGHLLPQPPARLQLPQQQTCFSGASPGGGHTVSMGRITWAHTQVQQWTGDVETNLFHTDTQSLTVCLCVQAAGETCKRWADRTLEEDCKDSGRPQRSPQQGEHKLLFSFFSLIWLSYCHKHG